MRPVIFLAFFASGFAGLVFELVWMRSLGLAMGSTTVAIAATASAYMGGLALGGYLGGRLSERVRSPLLIYGVVEIAVGMLGAAVPWIASQVGAVETGLALDSAYSRGMLRFALGVVVLGLPTTAMGMTLPLLAQWLRPALNRVAADVGHLYGANLAGATVGAWVAGFFLLPALGHHRTNLTAAAIYVILGIAAVALAWWASRRRYQGAPKGSAADSQASVLLRPTDEAGELLAANSDGRGVFIEQQRFVVFLLAVTGALAMGLQVLWTRAIGTALGPSTYAFSAILTVYLLGLGTGGALAARLSPWIFRPRLALAVALLVTGCGAYFGVAVVDDLPLVLRRFVLDESLTPAGLFRAEFAIAALALLPATIGMGTLFPLTIRAVVGGRVGVAVGRAIAINTVGAIVGSCVAVFVLLPLWGVEIGLLTLTGGYFFAALAMAMTAEDPPPFALKVAAPRRSLLRTLSQADPRSPVAVAAALLIILVSILPRWDVGQWTLGLFRVSTTRDYYAEETIEETAVIFHRDGLASTVTVEEEGDERWIKVDGKIDGSSSGDMPTQVLSGMLPLLVKPASENVVVIGCGTCVTIGVMLEASPTIKEATLVELEPAVLAGARLFADVNYEPWRDPRLRVVEDDGRNFLRRASPQANFDLIVSEPSNPWMTGAASLFTREFFQLARSRLTQGGAFVQWVQLYELAPERIKSLLKTFSGVFDHVMLFSAHRDSNDLLMVGSPSTIEIDWPGLKGNFARWQKYLTVAELGSPAQLIGLAMVGEAELADIDATINSDDNAYIEFGAPLDLVTYADADAEMGVLDSMNGHRLELLHRYFLEVPETDFLAIAVGLLRQGRLLDASAFAQRVVESPQRSQSLEASTTPTQTHRDNARRLSLVAGLLADEEDTVSVVDTALMVSDADYAQVVQLSGQGEDEQAIELTKDAAWARRSAAHNLLRGYLLYRSGQHDQAEAALASALEQVQEDGAVTASEAAIRYYQAKRAFSAERFGRAARYMFAYTRAAKLLSGRAKTE